MKKSMMLVVLLFALTACGIAAYAATVLGGEETNPTVTYDANKDDFSGDVNLFGDKLQNMFPGDKTAVPFDLKVTNFEKVRAKDISFTLKTEGLLYETKEEVVTEEEVAVNGEETATGEDTTVEDLAKYVHLYVGSQDNEVPLNNGTVALGSFTGDGTKTIPVWLSMDEGAGNEVKDTDFQLKWSITATVTKKGGGGGGGGGGGSVLNRADHYSYIVGYEDGTVRPASPITRAEVASVFFRMLTDEAREKYWMETNDYSDVNPSNWFNNPVSTLSNIGILTGYEDGTFRPNEPITRGEFATIAARFYDVAYDGADKFNDIAGHWAREYINQAAEKGIVKGYEDNSFRPEQDITRAEAMALINRVLERNPKTVDDLLPTCAQWTDNQDTGKWYYIDVEEATTSHNYERKSDKTEKWISLRTDPDWLQYETVK